VATERFEQRAFQDVFFTAKVDLLFALAISQNTQRQCHLGDLSPVPIVSIIMSMRDSAATLNSAIRSIIWQTLTDWELVLIDDGSRDDSAARAATFGDPRIRIIRHEESRGLACRLNEAVRLARGEFIARMDADDISYPQRLAAQVALLRSESSLDVVACKALVFRGDGDPVGIFPVAIDHAGITSRPLSGFRFPHPTWCGRAAWFRKHRYNERMFKAQDQELLLRTAATSRFASVDAVLLGYRQQDLDLGKSIKGRALFSRAIWTEGRKSGQYAHAMSAILAQVAKCAVDAVAIGLDLQNLLIKRRYFPVPAEEIVQWRSVWAAMTAGREH
jgi:glycosyltransferase involved in cell wall biosynthesis